MKYFSFTFYDFFLLQFLTIVLYIIVIFLDNNNDIVAYMVTIRG